MSTQHKPEGAGRTASAPVTETATQLVAVRTADSTFGGIGYRLTAKVEQAVKDMLASNGLLHIAQRAPASRVDKILGGWSKRPDNYSRDSVLYTPDNARKFPIAYSQEIARECGIVCDVEAWEYIAPEREVKYAAAAKLVREAIDANKLDALVKRAGKFDGKPSIENSAFLAAVNTLIEAQKRSLFS